MIDPRLLTESELRQKVLELQSANEALKAQLEQYTAEHLSTCPISVDMRSFSTPTDILRPCPRIGCYGSPEYQLSDKWAVRCKSCGVQGPERETREEARDGWNEEMPREEV